MGYLIILRGPTGSGKDTIDITNPLEDDFITDLKESLKRPYVIGMMFSGDANTENPDSWITNFKNRNYTILSVILNASLQTLIQRVNERCHHHKSPEEMKQHFEKFNQIRTVFASKAGVKDNLSV